jgi:hypothetical protein
MGSDGLLGPSARLWVAELLALVMHALQQPQHPLADYVAFLRAEDRPHLIHGPFHRYPEVSFGVMPRGTKTPIER